MAMLVVGVGLSAAFAARNGNRLTHYRTAQAVVGDLQALQGELKGCDKADHPDACRAEALAPRRASGEIERGQSVDDALAGAETARDAVGLPAPTERLTEWLNVGGWGWLGGVLLIIAGAVLTRREQAAEGRGEGTATGEQVYFPAYLSEIRARVEGIALQIADLPMDDDAPAVREALEDLYADWILPVVDSRAQFIAKHGIGPFAEYFSPFSGGERNLARCWSGLTDGHAVVAREALERAAGSFADAARMWDEVEVRQGGAPWQPAGPSVRRTHLTEEDVAEKPPRGMIDEATTAGAAALGHAEVPLTNEEPTADPETVSDDESVSDQVTAAAAPDADEYELELSEKEDLRALVREGIEVLEALVDEPFDVDDSDALVAAVRHAVQSMREGSEPPARWDHDTAARLLGLLWGEHLARTAGWRWVRLTVGSREGYAVVSNDRAHAAFPADYVRGLLREGAGDNRLVLIYEMVRDRRVLPSAPGTRTLLT